MARRSRYSPEVRERAVRMVFDHRAEYETEWATITSIAHKVGCSTETLRNWVRQAERDAGQRPGLSSDQLAELKELFHEADQRPEAVLVRSYANLLILNRNADPGLAHRFVHQSGHLTSLGIAQVDMGVRDYRIPTSPVRHVNLDIEVRRRSGHCPGGDSGAERHPRLPRLALLDGSGKATLPSHPNGPWRWAAAPSTSQRTIWG